MFNALKFSKELEKAGFSREQAEAAINTFYKFMEVNFATKDYIKDSMREDIREIIKDLDLPSRDDVRKIVYEILSELNIRTDIRDLKSDIAGIKVDMAKLRSEFAELKSEFSELRAEFAVLESHVLSLEYRLLIKLGSLFVVGIGILGTLIKFWLPH